MSISTYELQANIECIPQKIIILVIWTVLHRLKSMSSNCYLFLRVKAKYDVILSKHRGCATSLWLNRPTPGFTWIEKNKIILRTKAIWFLINVSLSFWFLTDQARDGLFCNHCLFSISNRKLYWRHIFVLQNCTSLSIKYKA